MNSMENARGSNNKRKADRNLNPPPLPEKSQSASGSHPRITTASSSLPNPNEGTSSSCQPQTQQAHKKSRAGVWEHFEKLVDSEGKETGKASCVWYMTKGTNSEEAKLSGWHFDQQAAREACVRMIIKDELSFRFVEREGFKEFCEVAVPQFLIPSRHTIVRDCYGLFVKEKQKLYDILASQCQRVSLTTDTWTSNQNLSYLCLTAHFIDSQWNMHKRILNFCVIKSHKGVNIGNAIEFCMQEWGLNRLMCITVDNASNNDSAISQLKKKLVKKDALILSGKHFHMRCCAHIIQLIVKDGLQTVDGSVQKIRSIVKYIRSSPQRSHMFRECAEALGIQNKTSLQLDCPTRWDSTYTMLDVAISYQKAFDMYEDRDNKFLREIGLDLPSERDWNNVRIITRFLKRFYYVTCKLSGSLYSTSNVYFPEIIRILRDLELCQNSKDSSLVEMSKAMREKFDKYWGSLDKTNTMLFVAMVLDPRYKMNFLKVKYTTYYGEHEATNLVQDVTSTLNDMMEEYKKKDVGGEVVCSSSAHVAIDVVDEMDEEIDEYFIQIEKEKKVVASGELDRYLEEFSEKFRTDFDILGWWKINEVRFPTLAKVAKDVLSIQASTVASEYAFSTGGRTLDKFRSSLTPTTAEVLICCQDWLRGSKQPIHLEEMIEELEKLEIDVIEDLEILKNVQPRQNLEWY